MQREYTLQGLTCANCANKIENAVKLLDGVSDAAVNLMTTTLRVEFDTRDEREVARKIEKTVHRYEPDVVVTEKHVHGKHERRTHEHEHGHGGKTGIVLITIGAVILGLGMVLEHFYEAERYFKLAVFLLSYVLLGGEVILRAAKNIARGQVFDENFLMVIATVGAFLIGEYPEAAAVMLFYQVGEYFQEMAVRKSKKSIAELMDIRPDFANVVTKEGCVTVSPDQVRVGDLVAVKPGERIPLDGVVVSGESMLDTSALTGESVPRCVGAADAVISGCINQSGLLTIEVTKEFGESTVSKIIDLVENAAGRKASTENFITKFSRYYTPVVVALAALLAAIPPLFTGGDWAGWINRGLIFLVISCPCALVISIPLGFFGGIGSASRRGILIKGGNYLEALNSLDTIVFDKTGTLTKGTFQVSKILPANGFGEAEILALAAQAESFSTHPIALSIQSAYGKTADSTPVTEHQDISGCGISAVIGGRRVLAGNPRLMDLEGIVYTESQDNGTKVYIAVDGTYAGCIVIEDEIKPDSVETVGRLKAMGIKTVMLTGDNALTAQAVSEELGIDEVHSGLLPDQKVEKVEMLEQIKSAKGKLAFVGDGINDAPVLARADVGIAMGGLGSDAAIEAADVVLMTDEPSKIVEAIGIARYTRRIVWQNIVFALGIKGLFLLMGALGAANMWEAVFADVGVALLAVLNAMRVMYKKDGGKF